MRPHAIHEAAHAVVGVHLGHSLGWVVAYRGGGGRCNFDIKKSRMSTAGGLATLLAGRFAEQLFAGSRCSFNYLADDRGDAEIIRGIESTIHPGIRASLRGLAEAMAKAELMLHGDEVRQVAKELSEQGVLTGFRVSQIVRPQRLRLLKPAEQAEKE